MKHRVEVRGYLVMEARSASRALDLAYEFLGLFEPYEGAVELVLDRDMVQRDAERTGEYDRGFLAGYLPTAQGHRPPVERPGLEEPYGRGYWDGFMAFHLERAGQEVDSYARQSSRHLLRMWFGIEPVEAELFPPSPTGLPDTDHPWG